MNALDYILANYQQEKYRQIIKSNEWINELFREPTMPFEALKPTELIQKVWLPLANINF